jgi:hypothetical protein
MGLRLLQSPKSDFKWKAMKNIRKISATLHSNSSRQQMSTITIVWYKTQGWQIQKITPQFAVRTSHVDPN